MKDDKLISSMDGIDDEFIEDAAPRGRRACMRPYWTAAVCLALAFSIALGAMLIGRGKDITAPPYTERPFPEVARPSKSLKAVIGQYLLSDTSSSPDFDYGFRDEMDGGMDSVVSPEGESNGSYVETTDNQVEGIIEADLYKTTDKYIFRYGNKSLHIYSIDGENSREISSLYISSRGSTYFTDMFLSEDGNTVTLINQEHVFKEEDHPYAGSDCTFIYSIDVSNVSEPKIVKTLSIAGRKLTVRKIDGKIYVVTTTGFDKKYIEEDKPETYIPGVYDGGELSLCNVDNIYYPEKINSARYVYVNVFRENDLTLDEEYAVLADHPSVTGVYFTKNHIAIEYQRGRVIGEEGDLPISENYTVLYLIDFSADTLRYRGSLDIRGWAETGQYSYDERDGYLRVVTSTKEWKRFLTTDKSASLYVYDLSTMTLSASVEDFAPEGEQATAVRFEGDKLYVCTAEITRFSDPVFFFDLSDYKNITQVNTGYINGFSSSLIDFGEGYLLGIGREDRQKGKIEVYKRSISSVKSVSQLLFLGSPGTVYKSYLIDRENNVFGFPCGNYRTHENGTVKSVYFILKLDDGKLRTLRVIDVEAGGRVARAFLRDGYVYYTGNDELIVVKLDS